MAQFVPSSQKIIIFNNNLEPRGGVFRTALVGDLSVIVDIPIVTAHQPLN